MQPQIDLKAIDDPMQLKALAYDQIAVKEQAENNLNAINQRLAQVVNGVSNEPSPTISDEDLGIEEDAGEP
jgi:hypothetical protein